MLNKYDQTCDPEEQRCRVRLLASQCLVAVCNLLTSGKHYDVDCGVLAIVQSLRTVRNVCCVAALSALLAHLVSHHCIRFHSWWPRHNSSPACLVQSPMYVYESKCRRCFGSGSTVTRGRHRAAGTCPACAGTGAMLSSSVWAAWERSCTFSHGVWTAEDVLVCMCTAAHV